MALYEPIIDEGGPASSFDESGMCEKLDQERNVGFDTTNTELDEGTKHLSSDNLVGRAVASALNQHRIVMRGDDSTREAVTAIKTDSISACGTVDFNLARVRRETLGWIFGCDTALNGEAPSRDMFLGQAKLFE